MTKVRNLAFAAAVLSLAAASSWARAQLDSAGVNREAIVGEVTTHVKVLAFNTDRPVHDVRLVVDGKEVASDSFQSSRNGIKLGVVTPPHGKRDVEVYVEIDNMGGFMKGSYRELREDNLLQTEYFGPGTNVVLKGWTQIYGLSQAYLGSTNLLYDLRVEIK